MRLINRFYAAVLVLVWAALFVMAGGDCWGAL